MISLAMMLQYRQTFPDSNIGFAEPSNRVTVIDAAGDAYDVTDMTDAEFLSTIAESKRAGKNLFFERGRKVEPLPPDIEL